MASNHGNLYNELLAMVLGRYRVIHDEVHDMGTGVGGGNRNGNGAGQPAKEERDRGYGERKGPPITGEDIGRGEG